MKTLAIIVGVIILVAAAAIVAVAAMAIEVIANHRCPPGE